MGEANGPVVSVEGLEVSFSTTEGLLRAVRGVDFEVARGECLGIVGESGSGKSVCSTSVLGLLDKTALVTGRIRLHGRELVKLSEEEKRSLRGKAISMIFQEPSRSFDPIYSIGKTFEETFRAKDPSMRPAECRRRAVELLTEVHIPQAEERLKNFPHQFSGGMLQRIMIALALSNDPDILIADEPTTALDVTIQAQIISLLTELQSKRELSLVFISHDLRLVGQVADRIMVMYGGVVLEIGPTVQVLGAPRSPYTRSLLNAVPAWGNHYTGGGLATIPGGVPDPVRPEPGCPFAPRCPLARDRCSEGMPALVPADDSVDGVWAGGSVGGSGEPDAAGVVGAPGAYRCIVSGVKQ